MQLNAQNSYRKLRFDLRDYLRHISGYDVPQLIMYVLGPMTSLPTVYLLVILDSYSGIRLMNPRLINPAAYYIQFAWNGIVPILSRYKNLG